MYRHLTRKKSIQRISRRKVTANVTFYKIEISLISILNNRDNTFFQGLEVFSIFFNNRLGHDTLIVANMYIFFIPYLNLFNKVTYIH